MTKAQAAFMQALNIVVALKNKNTTMLLRQKSPFALSLARCIVLVVIFYTVVLWGYVVRGFCIMRVLVLMGFLYFLNPAYLVWYVVGMGVLMVAGALTSP